MEIKRKLKFERRKQREKREEREGILINQRRVKLNCFLITKRLQSVLLLFLTEPCGMQDFGFLTRKHGTLAPLGWGYRSLKLNGPLKKSQTFLHIKEVCALNYVLHIRSVHFLVWWHCRYQESLFCQVLPSNKFNQP